MCTVSSSVIAAGDPFVGKWKMNIAKSKTSGLQEKIEDLGGNKYKFAFGDDVETVTFDGKDYPTKFGNTWAVTPQGPNKWTEVDKRDGKVVSTSTWILSEDGQNFTSTTKGTRADGSTFESEFKAKRIAGTSGLAGTWESTEMKQSAPNELSIEGFQADGISLVTAADKERTDLKFDGKDYAVNGPRVAPGSTVSGKRIDARTIELTGKLKDKLVYTQKMQVSEDGKTMTATVTFPGVSNAETDVYERQ